MRGVLAVWACLIGAVLLLILCAYVVGWFLYLGKAIGGDVGQGIVLFLLGSLFLSVVAVMLENGL